MQIGEILSQPEDSAAKASEAATAVSGVAPEAESMLTPEEALHSIHEEPEEETSARGLTQSDQLSGNASANAGQARQDVSNGSSFVQATGPPDGHPAQNTLLPGDLRSGNFSLLRWVLLLSRTSALIIASS